MCAKTHTHKWQTNNQRKWCYFEKKHPKKAVHIKAFSLKSEDKKRHAFKNWPLVKNPQFLSYPHETWLK